MSLPDEVTLPGGVRASAVTMGPDWFAVVTEDDRILIFERDSGRLAPDRADQPRLSASSPPV